jgi:hypothetical protein
MESRTEKQRRERQERQREQQERDAKTHRTLESIFYLVQDSQRSGTNVSITFDWGEARIWTKPPDDEVGRVGEGDCPDGNRACMLFRAFQDRSSGPTTFHCGCQEGDATIRADTMLGITESFLKTEFDEDVVAEKYL